MNVSLDGFDPTLLLLLVPLALLEIGLLVVAVVDLLREDRQVRGGNKGIWAVIIVFVNLIGPIAYLLVGRRDGPAEPAGPGNGAMPGWGSPHDPPIVAGHRGAAEAGQTPDALRTIGFHAGFGVRLFLSEMFAIRFDLKDYVYGVTVPNGVSGAKSADLQNQIFAELGVSVFFPFESRRLP